MSRMVLIISAERALLSVSARKGEVTRFSTDTTRMGLGIGSDWSASGLGSDWSTSGVHSNTGSVPFSISISVSVSVSVSVSSP